MQVRLENYEKKGRNVMKCSSHYDLDAVSQCVDCGKALCPECTNKFSFPVCSSCNLARIQLDKKFFKKNIILMVVFFFVGFFWDDNLSFWESLGRGYFFAGIPWGWATLSRITPNIFLFMPLVGWIVYFLFKAMLSMFIGMFVTPYKIYQSITGLQRSKQLEEYTKSVS